MALNCHCFTVIPLRTISPVIEEHALDSMKQSNEQAQMEKFKTQQSVVILTLLQNSRNSTSRVGQIPVQEVCSGSLIYSSH